MNTDSHATEVSHEAVAANDNYRGGYPALKWLIKQDAAAALAVWREIRDAAGTNIETTPSHDGRDYNPDDTEAQVVPDEPLASETMAEPPQDGPDEVWPEMLHEIRPSVDDMLSALGWIEWPWCGTRDNRGRYNQRQPAIGYAMRAPDGRLLLAEGAIYRPHSKSEVAALHGLVFFLRPKARRCAEGGMLVSYLDASGREQRPAFRANKPRGGKRPLRTDKAAQQYVDRKPAVSSPSCAESYQRPISGEPALGDYYHPLGRREPGKSLDIYGQIDRHGRYGVEESRALLRKLEADGGLPHVTKCPTVVAKGARFMGGLVAASGTASRGAPVWEPREVKSLGPVVEEVAARGTLADVGTAFGHHGTRPDRSGGRALLREARALKAANDNVEAVKSAA